MLQYIKSLFSSKQRKRHFKKTKTKLKKGKRYTRKNIMRGG